MIFCEATAIYGVILAIILSNKTTTPTNGVPTDDIRLANYLNFARFAGYSIFWSGLSVGLTNLGSGICVGVAGASCAIADAQDPSLFVKVLVGEWCGKGGGRCDGGIPGLARCCTAAPHAASQPHPPVVEIFGSALGIFGIIIGIIQSNNAEFPVIT